MLARSGPLPATGDYAHEVKWDGFRAIGSTDGPLRVRSRRGWVGMKYLAVAAFVALVVGVSTALAGRAGSSHLTLLLPGCL
jgi:ATP-dependent DNA ligase